MEVTNPVACAGTLHFIDEPLTDLHHHRTAVIKHIIDGEGLGMNFFIDLKRELNGLFAEMLFFVENGVTINRYD